MGGRYFLTPVPSHSQCVTPTHERAQFQASGFWAKSQKVAPWNNNNEAAGREEPRDLRSPETLGGDFECDRETRPHAVPRPEKRCASTVIHAHKSLRCTTQSTRAYTRACSSHACTYRCFTHSRTHSLTLSLSHTLHHTTLHRTPPHSTTPTTPPHPPPPPPHHPTTPHTTTPQPQPPPPPPPHHNQGKDGRRQAQSRLCW